MNYIFKPFVPEGTKIPEITITSVTLGILLSIIMSASNAYLGLYAGLTLSASIPAAVISMGILKGIFHRGSILENNIVQTIASSGQSIASGVIFTMPALIIAKVWTDFDYWTVTLIAGTGGVLGILFMIPLRHMLITGKIKELSYPEGVACAEILQTGEHGGNGVQNVFYALGLGLIFKFLINGISIIKGTVEGAANFGSILIYGGMNISPALLGVGYIIGFNVSLLVFLGGFFGWLICIPILTYFSPISDASVTALDSAWLLWSTKIRYIGVGAMVVGGLWSIWSIRHGMVVGIKEIAFALKNKNTVAVIKRTNKNMNLKSIIVLLLLSIMLVLCIYFMLTKSFSITFIATIIMIVTAFFFVAVSSYISGLVGSSNNPVSGMTICTVLFTSILMILLHKNGISAIIATLGVAGVVCCAVCTAGDVSQDLKTGHILGSTPSAQQWAMIIGAISASFVMAPVLSLLHKAYGIGTGVPGSLKAPQASLFAKIVETMFSTSSALPWRMIIVGIILAIGLIILNKYLETTKTSFRAYVMPVAVGIYLPWSLSMPMLIGGILYSITEHKLKGLKDAEKVKEGTHNGILFSSGLIAGESISGILIAIPIVAGVKLPIEIISSNILSITLFATMGFFLYNIGLKNKN